MHASVDHQSGGGLRHERPPERRRRIDDDDRRFHETRRFVDGEEQAGTARKEIRPDLHRRRHAVRPVDRVHGFLLLVRRF